MKVTDDEVAIDDLIATIKAAIVAAGISETRADRDLRVSAIELTLNTVATRRAGGGVEFRVPVIGFPVKLGHKLSRAELHKLVIKLVPPPASSGPELRGPTAQGALVDAVEQIRAALAQAEGGDDPFVLAESSIEISFAVTSEGTISLGFDGGFDEAVTHVLKLTIVAVVR